MGANRKTKFLCPIKATNARKLASENPIENKPNSEGDIARAKATNIAKDKPALAKLRDKMAGFDPFTLAGLEAMTSLAASLTIGLTALEPDADPVALWQAASLEEEWQADEWGRDYEAEERRAKRQTDFLRACEFAKATAA